MCVLVSLCILSLIEGTFISPSDVKDRDVCVCWRAFAFLSLIGGTFISPSDVKDRERYLVNGCLAMDGEAVVSHLENH